MKKFLLFMLVYSQLAVFANYNDIYILDIKYDWINKSMVEKEAIISEIKDIIFDKPIEKQEDFKSRFKDKLKDKIILKIIMQHLPVTRSLKGITSLHFITRE